MRNPVVMVLIAVGFVLALSSPFRAALFYWFIAIFRPQDWMYGNPLAWFPISLAVAVILLGYSVLTWRFPRLDHPVSLLLVTWLALEALSTSLNGCGELSDRWISYLWRAILMVLVTERYMDTPRRFYLLMATIVGSLWFFAAKAGYVSLLGGGTSLYDVSPMGGSLSDSNAFAMGTAMTFWIVVAIARNLNNPVVASEGADMDAVWRLAGKWFLYAILPFGAYAIMATYSRSSALAFVAGGVAYLFLERRLLGTSAVVVLLLVVTLVFVPLPEGYTDRLESIFADEEELDSSAASRPHFWRVATEMVKVYPAGVGARCYGAYYDMFDFSNGLYGGGRSVHSSHFQVLAQSGYAGVAIWFALFFFCLLALHRVGRRAALPGVDEDQGRFLSSFAHAIAAGVVAFFVGGSFIELAYSDLLFVLFIAAVALDRQAKALHPRAQPTPAAS